MGTSFFELCIRRPVLTLVMSIALIVFGVIGLQRLPVRELPDIDPPIVNVLAVYPGASAETIETEVTQRLEEAIASVEGIKLLTSNSREQVASITIEFVQGRNVDLAAQDVRDKVSGIENLPDDLEPPIIAKQEASAQPIMWVAFFSDRYSTEELTRIAENQVRDRLQTIPGVSSVIIGGAKRFAVRLWLDSTKMAARGVTVLDVERALRTQSIELPSGRIENLDRELTIQTRGRLQTPAEFNELVIRQDDLGIVRLRDIGQARDGVEDERSVARFNGKPSVGLGIVRQSKANTVTVAQDVRRIMTQLQGQLPSGIEFDFPYDEAIFIEKSIKEVWETLGTAFLLVVASIFLFLRSARSTLIPVLAIPVSLLATFGVLYLFGFSINTFTLLALVLAIGIVVDDAIVVLEDIFRRVEGGLPPFQAAIESMRQIGFAIITITLSLVAVFLPLVFLGGLVGRLLLEFSVALCVAVLVSSFVALTLSPMVAARILKPAHEIKHGPIFNFFESVFDGLSHIYKSILLPALKYSWILAPVAFLGIMAATVALWLALPQDFLPSEDKGRFFGLVLAPEGATSEYTDRQVRKAEALLQANPAVKTYFTATALPFDGPGDPAFGLFFVRLQEHDRPHVRDVVEGPTGLGGQFFALVEGAFTIPILPKAVNTGFGQPFQLVLKNQDLQALDAATGMVTGVLYGVGMVQNPRSEFSLTKAELRVAINRERANALGISVADISRTLQILFGGQDLARVTRDGKEYDVIVQLERESRLTPSDLDTLFVRNANGQLVQLSNVVTASVAPGPTQIERFNRERSSTISATPVAGIPLGIVRNVTEGILLDMLAKGQLPPGTSIDWNGEARELTETSGQIYLFFGLAVLVVFLVLAAQFESFTKPLIIMVSLPLAFVGSFLLLWALAQLGVPNMNINLFSQVGLVLLVALVTKNAILLVEFANQRVAAGSPPRQAMAEAGAIRLRPILMTSLSTILGILPIALALGEASEGRQPLGVAVVGGLISSTLLTLFLVPMVYVMFADAEGWFRGLWQRSPQPPPLAPATAATSTSSTTTGGSHVA